MSDHVSGFAEHRTGTASGWEDLLALGGAGSLIVSSWLVLFGLAGESRAKT